MTSGDMDLLDRACEALWEAWMAQHKIAGGKEYASIADLRRYAANGQRPAVHYLAAMKAEVRAVARVILSEPPSDEMLEIGKYAIKGNPSTFERDDAEGAYRAMTATLLQSLEGERS
jgi:hypothetical protein